MKVPKVKLGSIVVVFIISSIFSKLDYVHIKDYSVLQVYAGEVTFLSR